MPLYLFWLVDQVQEPPAGELALLRWALGLSLAAVIFMAGYIVRSHQKSLDREDEIRENHQKHVDRMIKELTESIDKLAVAQATTAENLAAFSQEVNSELRDFSTLINITDEMRRMAKAVVDEVNSAKRRDRSNF